MFQFTAFPLHDYGFIMQWLRFAQPGFPIRISPDRWLCASTRSFSQLFTSFIGSWCQGIHPLLLLAWPCLKKLDSRKKFFMPTKGWFFSVEENFSKRKLRSVKKNQMKSIFSLLWFFQPPRLSIFLISTSLAWDWMIYVNNYGKTFLLSMLLVAVFC